MENGVPSLFSLAFAYQVKLFGEVANHFESSVVIGQSFTFSYQP